MRSKSHLRSVVILFSSQLYGFFAGDHRGVVTPVPIPNTEVKGPIAEGSAGLARVRVGRRRQYFFQKIARRLRRTPPSGPVGLGFAKGDTAFFILIVFLGAHGLPYGFSFRLVPLGKYGIIVRNE